jgi:multidrug efflux pump
MNFTDIFIRRPVLASVVSLVILVVGLRSFSSLQVLAYPKTENGVVTISTSFPGADPDPSRASSRRRSKRPSRRRTASIT